MAIELLTDRPKTGSGIRDLYDIDPEWFEQIRVALGYGGPYKAAMRWQAEAWSQAIIYPAVRNPDPTGDPIALENTRLEKAVAKFTAGHRHAAAMITQAYGQLVCASTTTGERDGVIDPAAGPGGEEHPLSGYANVDPAAYLDDSPDINAGEGPPEDGSDLDDLKVYLSWTVFNLSEAPDVWQLAPNKNPGGGARIDTAADPGARIGRWWNPDYVSDPDSPDSPTRDALNDLNLLYMLMGNIASTCKNRMWARGAYKVPNDCNIAGPSGGPTPKSVSSLAEEFYEAAKVPISSAGEAAGALPLVIEGPAESLDKGGFDSFSTPLDARIGELVELALRNLAITADTPPDVMLGRSGTHWDAFLSAEQNININLSSGLEQVLDAFYAIVVKPYVEEEHAAGRLPSGVDVDDVMIGFSFRRLSSRYGTTDPLRGFVGRNIDDISDADELQMLVLTKMAEKGVAIQEAEWYAAKLAELWESRRRVDSQDGPDDDGRTQRSVPAGTVGTG
jgi:hypothetical protein